MNDFLQWLFGDKGQLAIAGALGGVVRLLTLRERLWPDGAISVIVGCLCALYLGPLAIPSLEPILGKLIVDPISRGTFSGFLIGVGGLSVSGFLIDVWRARRKFIEDQTKSLETPSTEVEK